MLRPWLCAFYQGKYSILMMSLLALPIAQALVDGHPLLELGYWLAFVGMLTVATTVVGHNRHAFWTAALLGTPCVIAVLTLPLTGFNMDHAILPFVLGRSAVFLALLGALSVLILRDVSVSRRVMFDQVCGGLCVYLMIGYAWGLMYAALERLSQGAFAIDLERFGLVGGFSPMRLNSVMTYYSFVTLTTLGYGDIAPVSPMARGLVWVEAVLGQIYMAVFVARLVSQYLAQGTVTITVDRTRGDRSQGARGDAAHPYPSPHEPSAARSRLAPEPWVVDSLQHD
jgi:hypothetical protein